jgi:hypothetical protein
VLDAIDMEDQKEEPEDQTGADPPGFLTVSFSSIPTFLNFPSVLIVSILIKG